MKIDEIDLFDELFTHVSDDGRDTQTTYNVTRLFDHVKAHADEPGVLEVRVPVEKEHADYCVSHRGLEVDRVKVLLEHPEYLAKPVLFVVMPDGSHLLVDGTHRYVTFYYAKAKFIPAYIVPWSMAEPFVVEDMPTTDEELLMGPSGIGLLRQLRGGMN